MPLLNLDIDKVINDFEKVALKMLSQNMPFENMKSFLNDEFDKYAISNAKRIDIIANVLINSVIAFTAKAADIAINIQQLEAQIRLSEAETEFNKARTDLVKAQTENELAKKPALEREIKSYDDQLRIKEAELLSNAVFGYAAGGVSVPTQIQTKMLEAIDEITPPELNSNSNTTPQNP